ncbi:MAG: hypothetical protein WBO68_11020, partial [Pyrinomonadaceae bacterium]
MKKAESRSNFDGISRGILALFVFAIFCVSANITASYGTEPDFSGTDETRKIIKQSRKLTRAGLLDDAEKMLRRVVETDSRSTSAKVELAF